MRSDLDPFCRFGHIAGYAELLEAWHGQESAVLPFRTDGPRTRHLRSDLYVCAHLTEAELSAAWSGGVLDCVTVLAGCGLPVPAHWEGEIHLRLTRGDSRAAARRHVYAPTSHVHWSRLRTPIPSVGATMRAAGAGKPISRLQVPVREALRQAMASCLSYEESAVVLAAIAADDGWRLDDAAHALAAAPRRVERALRALGGVPPVVDDALIRLRSRHLS